MFSPFFSPARYLFIYFPAPPFSVISAPFQRSGAATEAGPGGLGNDVSPNLARSRWVSLRLGRSRPIRLGLARRSCQVTTYADNVLCVCLRVRSYRSVGMTSASAARHHDPAGTAFEVGQRPKND